MIFAIVLLKRLYHPTSEEQVNDVLRVEHEGSDERGVRPQAPSSIYVTIVITKALGVTTV